MHNKIPVTIGDFNKIVEYLDMAVDWFIKVVETDFDSMKWLTRISNESDICTC